MVIFWTTPRKKPGDRAVSSPVLMALLPNSTTATRTRVGNEHYTKRDA